MDLLSQLLSVKFKPIYNSAVSTQFLTFFFSFLSLSHSQKCSVSGKLVLGSYANYWDQGSLSKKKKKALSLASTEKKRFEDGIGITESFNTESSRTKTLLYNELKMKLK